MKSLWSIITLRRSSVRPVPPPIFDRLKIAAPNDGAWWDLWMGSYAVPAFITAWEAGVLSVLCDGAKTEAKVSEFTKLSERSCRVLLAHMTALGVLRARDGKFRASPAIRRKLLGREWSLWVEKTQRNPLTQVTFFRALTGNVKGNFTPPTDPQLLKLYRDSERFAAVAAADKLKLFGELPASLEALAPKIPGLPKGPLAKLLKVLVEYKILEVRGNRFLLTKKFRPFLDPKSVFYKGAILRLMETAPASPQQAWEAIIKEKRTLAQNSGTTLMDQTTIEGEQGAYAFAEHMDAQGAGFDVVAAQKAFRAGDRVLDVGGGGGSYSILGAALFPRTKFLILEKGAMVGVARHWVSTVASQLKGEVRVEARDMFSPADWETVTRRFQPNKIYLSNVFHDWNPETNLRLAELAFSALPDKGELVVHEMLLSSGGVGPKTAVSFSEVLRIWTEGMQYRRTELVKLLRRAGFKQIRIVRGHGNYSLIFAKK